MTTAYGFRSLGLRKVINISAGLGEFAVHNATEFMHQMDAISGKIDFTCGTQKFAQRITEPPNAVVYAYNFVQKTPNNGFPDWAGAMHGYEIKYVFGMPFSQTFKSNCYGYTEEEARQSEAVMKYWANYARSGNECRSRASPDWPKCEVESGNYMEVGLDQTVQADNRKEECNFWNIVFLSLIQGHLRGEDVPEDIGPNLEPYPYVRRPLSEFV
ncbi:unnamed protein product [Dibothriocephalus latus]|uniref:Carboxylesterase type B domain-containing protein n=1 Tax=Dibothriocephalus latus TaxID=60516 RepID=A0A3P7LDR3_DIBLA|nr:unnamed protein product [Dibothriocephalus latus]